MSTRTLVVFALVVTASLGCRTAGRRADVANVASPAAQSVPPPSITAQAQSQTQVASARATAGQQVRQAQFEEVRTPRATLGNQSVRIPGVMGPDVGRAVPAAQQTQLDLRGAIETSLAQNPDLLALRRNDPVAVGVAGVANTYPFNPFVQVQATPLQKGPNGEGNGTTYHYVLLMQQLQLAHQQRYREEIGASSLNFVRWNIHQAELLNMAQTERLYFTALYLRGLRDIARDLATLNAELLSVLDKQLAAGAAAGADVAIVRMDAMSTQRQARLAEANYQTALLDLQRQLNLSPGTPLELPGSLIGYTFRSADPEAWLDYMESSLPQKSSPDDGVPPLARIASARPDVMAARADLVTSRANERLARASRTPDLIVGPYYQRNEAGFDFFGFRAETDLMINNTGEPLVRQRQAEISQRYAVWQAAQTRATLEAEAAVNRYERALALLHAMGEKEPTLPIELQRLEEQFKAGEVDILRLFAARSSMIQNRRAQLDTLNEVAQAAAQVTASTGLPPDALAVPPRGH